MTLELETLLLNVMVYLRIIAGPAAIPTVKEETEPTENDARDEGEHR